MRQTGNHNLIWHLSCQQDDQIWWMEMNMPENCGFLHNWRMKINFSKQKSFKKSVFHRLVNLFTVRFLCLIVRAWDCPQNRETLEVCSWMGGGLSNALTNLCMALYCHKNSVQKYKNKEQKIQWEINKAMHKFVTVLDKYGGGRGGMYFPSLYFKYGHFPFWGVGQVPLPGWYLPMLQFHLALCCFFKAMLLKNV